MATGATMPTPLVSAPGTNTGSNSGSSGSSTTTGIADNFQTFLTLLTTQLQNQNPLDPLDTNQFTAQLVQFAGVEQQLKSNEQLKSLVALEKSAQSADLRRQQCRRRRQHRTVRRLQGHLEFHCAEGIERHNHDYKFGGTDRL